MLEVIFEIIFCLVFRMIQLMIWMAICLGIIAIVAIIQWISKRKLIRWVIKIAAVVTACIIILMLVDDLSYIIKYISMQYGIWLASCLTITMIIVLMHLINKKIRKKKPVHWTIKLTGCAAFYVISFFVCLKLFGSYPGNWLETDEEYRELAYELYYLNLEYYEYDYIHEGPQGEIVFEFRSDDVIWDRTLARTVWQRDFITVKNAVEEYIKANGSFEEERIKIEFLAGFGPANAWEYTGFIYNFNPETGETADADNSCWFVTDIEANNCTELAEFYQDFSWISADVQTMDGIQDLASLSNLTYLQLYVSDTVNEDNDLKEKYLKELNTLLPDCEIYLKHHNITSPF